MEQLTSLKSLFLDAYNKNGVGISGPLLPFSNMPKLRSLHLGSNSMTGSIPSNLLAGVDNFDDLVEVDISSNHLTGSIPSQLADFKNLNFLATDNYIEAIDDALCSKFSFSCDALLCPAGTFNSDGRQTSEDTPCEQCPVSDVPIPPYMGQTSCLSNEKEREREILELFFIAMAGDKWKKKDGWLGEEDYCSWHGIECVDSTVHSISLGSNNLFGTPPPELFELSNLNNLWLYSNPIDFQFEGIGKSSNLKTLRLDSTGLKSLDGIESARSLVEIDVRFNRLNGALPDLSNLGQLESFSCSSNSLSGLLPSFSNNKKLISLRLGSNKFSGPVPAFESHPAMRTIDVSDNLLSGTIPDDFLAAADISASIFLDLSSNRLIGSVPKSLSHFVDLVLYLRDNQIDDIPAELCLMQDWNQGDVGLSGCDGILCPPNTFAPATGRASRQGSKCVRCDEAVYFGATTCGLHSSAARSVGQLFLGVIAPSLASLWLLQ
jgi:Leucine-rich repeat (LRR) protein